MNRRQFITTSFMFGLLLAVGIRPQHEPKKEIESVVIRRVANADTYSYDDGRTWTEKAPARGTLVSRIEGLGELYPLEQKDPRKMPTVIAVCNRATLLQFNGVSGNWSKIR